MTHKILEEKTLLENTLKFHNEQSTKLQNEIDSLNKLMSQLEDKFENFPELKSLLLNIINDTDKINNILLFQSNKISKILENPDSEIDIDIFLKYEEISIIKITEIINSIIDRIYTQEMIELIDSKSQPKHNLYIKYYELYDKNIYNRNVVMYKTAMISINDNILKTIPNPSYNDIKNDMLYKQYYLTLQYKKDTTSSKLDDKTLMLLMLLYIQVINNTVVNFVITISDSKSSESDDSIDK